MNGAENALFAPVGEPILGENRPGFVTFLQVFWLWDGVFGFGAGKTAPKRPPVISLAIL